MSQQDRPPPLPSIDSMINDLSLRGVSIHASQLEKPTPEFLEDLYMAITARITGVTMEMVHTLANEFVEQYDENSAFYFLDRDIISASAHRAMITFHVSKIADWTHSGFSGRDIYQPTKQRTRQLLAEFINFLKYDEQECEPVLAELRERSKRVSLEQHEVTSGLQKVQQNIEKLKIRIAEEEPKCDHLRAENDGLVQHLTEMKRMQEAAMVTIKDLKEEKQTLLKRREVLNAEISSVSDSVSQTRLKIVQSPDRIKRTITTMGATVVEEKKMYTVLEMKSRDLQQKANALLTIEKDVRSCVEQLQTVHKEVISLENSQRELDDLKGHLDEKSVEQTELRLRSERVDRQLSNAQEKLERAKRHAEEKRTLSQHAMERLKRDYDAMSEERRLNDSEMEHIRAQAEAIESEMASHLKQSEAELNELLAEYWKIRHQTDVYMETLANKLNMRVSREK